MGNYIICLAHFCELHGPSTIVCTQTGIAKDKLDYLIPGNSKLQQTCQSCQLILPDNSRNLLTKQDSTIFISTHYPASQTRYTSLTKLVMKSLSVETTADLSKPMFFGDVIYGYCINKIFKINDINARGSERKYSLMVISDGESDLLMNWDIITLYFNEIIDLIQKRVAMVAAKEVNQDSNCQGGDVLNERYLRRSLIKPKSLLELTNDDEIFVKFHLWAVSLLKDILK
ncbi:Protein LST7 [Spathaspora sp. JA1]|nr:Protein LST7 [Spathaspora sp. JA1]